MSDKPILMSAPMIRAVLSGTKTQTRRILKVPHNNPLGAWEASDVGGAGVTDVSGRPVAEGPCIWHTRTGDTIVPIWAVKDRLWARETWGFNPDHPSIPEFVCFRADPGHEHDGIKWRPSIHMPRLASRITLEVTGVRVERLNAITEADAVAEGVTKDCPIGYIPAYDSGPHRYCFAQLWDHINGSGAWAANPWVAAIEFRRVGNAP